MEDEKNIGGVEAAETPDAEKEGKGESAPEQASHASLTQDEVNDIVRERLAKRDRQLFSKYGVEDEKALDALFEKAKGYDEQAKSLEEIQAQLKSANEELALKRHGVLPEREDDAKTYFKGKGMEMSEEALKQVLETHPEWLKAEEGQPKPNFTKPEPIGAEKGEKAKSDPREEAAKLWGFPEGFVS